MKTKTRLTKEQTEKVSGTVLTCAAALFIVIFGLLIYILPQHETSERENRVLQTFPAYTLRKIFCGDAADETAAFYADQFPARAFFTTVKAGAELASGKMENNEVILGTGNTLLSRPVYTEQDMTKLKKNVTAAETFITRVRDSGTTAAVLLAPRAVDVLEDHLPSIYNTAQLGAVWDSAAAALGADASLSLSLRDELTQQAQAGAYVWYRTDHHWTTCGAYAAYESLGEALGYEALPQSAFAFDDVSDAFLGTTYSSSGLYDYAPDTLTLARYPGDDELTTAIIALDGSVEKSFAGLYDFDKLDTKDKYSVFLGGNYGEVHVTHKDGEYPTLLVIKDSFSHSLAPFLSCHYDIVLVDLRYYRGDFNALYASVSPDAVLLCWGINELVTSNYAVLNTFLTQ